MRNPTLIGHLDADCFYVSAERVRYPKLIGVPVGVIGNQGACVIAKSYEMKGCGVKTGMPIWEALKLCPDGVYVKRDFHWYEVLSRKMLDVVREASPRAEYYSIDEFFFEAAPPPGQTHLEYALAIRDRIMRRVGVPITIGLARSKTLAKLISDTAKPFGARVVADRAGEEALLDGLPVTEIAGITGRRQRRLQPWGINTCLDLARADRAIVRELLTASGEALWWELNGEPVTGINTRRVRHKMLSRGGSFGEATDRPTVLWAWLVRNVERLIEELRYHRMLPGRLGVWVGYRDGTGAEGGARMEVPSDRFDDLLDAFRPCLRTAWRPRAAANRMHLLASDLRDRGESQLGLFTAPTVQGDAIRAAKEAINAKHGRFAIRSAATLPLKGIYEDTANAYDICDVRGKACF